MKWKNYISGKDNKPEVGMRIKVLKGIDNNQATTGLTGTIIYAEGYCCTIWFDTDFGGGHQSYRIHAFEMGLTHLGTDETRSFNSFEYDWNQGRIEII